MLDPYGSLPILATLPGLVGDIARKVDNALKTSSPEISLPAALSFVSALKAGRVTCGDRLSPNIYTCVMAGSGTGKSQAQRAIQQVVIDAGITALLMGKPASDAGLVKALQTNNRRYLIWDEFGLALSELAKTTQGYRALILSTIMDLFSSSGGIYLGKQYAKEEKRIDVKEPCLSIFAASTPNRFFGALNQDFVEDGFLGRWLLFFVPEAKPKKRELYDESDDIIERILAIDNREPPTGVGNIADVVDHTKMQMVINPSDKKINYELFEMNLLSSKTEIQRVFWSRAYEHYIKLCLVLSDVAEVSHNVSIYAAHIVNTQVSAAIEKCEGLLFRSVKERERERFKGLIKLGEEITLTVLAQRAKHLNLTRPERRDLIEDQVEGGFWERSSGEGDGRKKNTCLKCVKM